MTFGSTRNAEVAGNDYGTTVPVSNINDRFAGAPPPDVKRPMLLVNAATAKTSLQIGMLWHCVYPWDIRLEKIAAACIERGHKVCVVSKGKDGLPAKGHHQGAEIVRVLPSFPGLGKAGSKALGYPLFFNPIWQSAVVKAFSEAQVDLIVVRDLPLAMMAVWAGKRLNKPVVIDMAENYPAALQAYQNPKYRPFLFNNAWLPRKYEERAVANLQHVL